MVIVEFLIPSLEQALKKMNRSFRHALGSSWMRRNSASLTLVFSASRVVDRMTWAYATSPLSYSLLLYMYYMMDLTYPMSYGSILGLLQEFVLSQTFVEKSRYIAKRSCEISETFLKNFSVHE